MKIIAFPTERTSTTSRLQSRSPREWDARERSVDLAATTQKFVGLDAVRAGAALGVVLFHACVPYLQNPMPGLSWTVRDSANASIDWLFWGIEVFIMPLFLVLAGFFAWQTLSRRGVHLGARTLVTNRAKRLLIPLAFAVCVVLPLDLYIWVLAWVAEGIVEPIKLKSMKFDGVVDRDLWGLSHLWFLLYVFLYVVVTAIVARVNVLRNAVRKVAEKPALAFTVLAISAAVTLGVAPNVVWGFQHEFYPVLSKWIYSGTFFAAGLLIAKVDPSLSRFQNKTRMLGIASVMLLLTAVSLGRWHLAIGENAMAQAGLAIVTVLAAYAVTLLAIAVSRPIPRLPVGIQYLAAASFWIYLVHHPILGLVHLDLKLLLPNANPILKMILAFAISVGGSVLTYEALVRCTRLGRILGMQWQSQTVSAVGVPLPRDHVETEPAPQRIAA